MTFTSTIQRQSEALVSSIGPAGATPALFITTCTPPKADSVRFGEIGNGIRVAHIADHSEDFTALRFQARDLAVERFLLDIRQHDLHTLSEELLG